MLLMTKVHAYSHLDLSTSDGGICATTGVAETGSGLDHSDAEAWTTCLIELADMAWATGARGGVSPKLSDGRMLKTWCRIMLVSVLMHVELSLNFTL